jgi:hypothetical protein
MVFWLTADQHIFAPVFASMTGTAGALLIRHGSQDNSYQIKFQPMHTMMPADPRSKPRDRRYN